MNTIRERTNGLVNTSVADVKSLLPHCADVDDLEFALVRCEQSGYKSKASLIRRRIKQLKPRPMPSPDQAGGCKTCLGCLAWPRVTRHPGSHRWGTKAYWSVACDRCTTVPSTGSTREIAVKEWNEANYRL